MDIKEQVRKFANVLCTHEFRTAYLIRTGKKLDPDNIEEVIEHIENGDITYEDLFEERLNVVDRFLDEDLRIFWDDNYELFDIENFHPQQKKLTEGGGWIKVRTENGYQLHYAKVSTRKRRLREEITKVNHKLIKVMNQGTKEAADSEIEISVTKEKFDKQIKDLEHQRNYLLLIEAIGLTPYEIRYQRTKTQQEYLNPYQYEILSDEDLQIHIDGVKNNVPHLKMRFLYTDVNKDQIFYLRSRGIDEKTAMILANLKQCWFEVDMVAMSNYFHETTKVKIVAN